MTWFRCVDKSGGSAVLGHKSITQNGTYNASSDNLDGYDQVTVNVPSGGLPSYMSIHEQTLEANSPTLTVPYDSTRQPIVIACYCTDTSSQTYKATVQLWRLSYTSGNGIRWAGYTNNGNPPSDTSTGSYGSVVFDDENETVTFSLREGSYAFKRGVMYRTIIIYEET